MEASRKCKSGGFVILPRPSDNSPQMIRTVSRCGSSFTSAVTTRYWTLPRELGPLPAQPQPRLSRRAAVAASLFALALAASVLIGLRGRSRLHDTQAAPFTVAVLYRWGFVYRCTLPEPSPFNKLRTSSTLKRLKSPGMECFKQEAATANSSAS